MILNKQLDRTDRSVSWCFQPWPNARLSVNLAREMPKGSLPDIGAIRPRLIRNRSTAFQVCYPALKGKIELEKICFGDDAKHRTAVAVNHRDALTDKATGDLYRLLQ